jgi:hypothetical protein
LIAASIVHSQTQYRFNINNINLPFNNKGVLADVNIPPDGPLGRFGVGTFLFSGGFMISGYNADTLWACAEATASLIENFVPGNVDSNQLNPIYKIYVNNNSSSPDYIAWQDYVNAVNSGAGFYDGNGDSIYNPIDLNSNGQWDPNEDKPDIIGDKMTWCVYNDGVPGNQRLRFAGINPVGLEVHQSLFGYASTSLLGNVIFIRYKLLNTSKVNTKLDSVYFSTWADPDLGTDYSNDLAGCDTLRNSGFVYNAEGSDPAYGVAVPSFFIRFLEGPVSYISGETFIDNNSNGIYDDGVDTPLDTAYNRKGKDIGVKQFPGAKNLDISSFIHYIQSDPLRGDPNDEFEARNYMKGRLKLGEVIDPCADAWGGVFGGVDCNLINPDYWYSGNPNTQIGWLNNTGTDQRILINTGPFDLEVGKPITIIVAYIVGQGTNRLNSITKAREIAEYTHNFYLSNFGEFPVGVDEDAIIQLPNDFKLEQNYPNPFNPTTSIRYALGSKQFISLKVYDVLGNEIATLVNEEKSAGIYVVEFDGSSFSSGIYFYRLQTDNYFSVKKMIILK